MTRCIVAYEKVDVRRKYQKYKLVRMQEDRRVTTPLIAAETRVQISSSMDFKSRVREWWNNLHLKTFCQHMGLLVALAGYTVIGGLVSEYFVLPVSRKGALQTSVQIAGFRQKKLCVRFIVMVSVPLSVTGNMYSQNAGRKKIRN